MPAKLKVAAKAFKNDLLTPRLPTKLSVAVNPASSSFLVSDPANASVAVNPESIIFFTCATANESVAVSDLPTCLVKPPAKLSVAVNALINSLLMASDPTNESVAVNPESMIFLISAALDENVAVSALNVLVGPKLPTNDNAAVKLWINSCGP